MHGFIMSLKKPIDKSKLKTQSPTSMSGLIKIRRNLFRLMPVIDMPVSFTMKLIV